jgi:ABC-type iron transport system FetAB permease component
MAVPIVGMLAGSTISGMVVALTSILREVQENRDKVETYLAFGASRIEASMPIAQQALLIALTPVVNQMRCALPYVRERL